MKHFIALTLSLFTLQTLVSCSPAVGPNIAPIKPNTQASTQLDAKALDSKIDLFDAMLLVKNSNNVSVPVLPSQIESLMVEGKSITTSNIWLPGSETAEALKTEKARLEAANKVTQGQPMVAFGGNGAYTFVVPKSTMNNVLSLKLKGDSQTYQLIRTPNMARGTFVMDKGQIQGGFNTRGAFSTKQAGAGFSAMDFLRQVFENSGTYFAAASFDIESFVNYFVSNGGKITLTTEDNQELVFETAQPQAAPQVNTLTDAQENAVEQAVEELVGADLSPLLGYIGSWEITSPVIKGLIPGGRFTLDVAAKGSSVYSLTANVAAGSYSGEGQHKSGSATSDVLNLNVSAGNKSLTVQFRLVNNNTLGVKITNKTNVSEIADTFLNQEVTLARRFCSSGQCS